MLRIGGFEYNEIKFRLGDIHVLGLRVRYLKEWGRCQKIGEREIALYKVSFLGPSNKLRGAKFHAKGV